MSETTTLDPFLASSTAIDCPIPLAAPVTMATFPVKSNKSVIFTSSLLC